MIPLIQDAESGLLRFPVKSVTGDPLTLSSPHRFTSLRERGGKYTHLSKLRPCRMLLPQWPLAQCNEVYFQSWWAVAILRKRPCFRVPRETSETLLFGEPKGVTATDQQNSTPRQSKASIHRRGVVTISLCTLQAQIKAACFHILTILTVKTTKASLLSNPRTI